jgi:acetoin utilization protein AcuC
MAEAAFIYSDILSKFDYGDDHPFKPIRARNTMELCNRHGLLYAVGVTRPEPSPASRDQLELFHSREYLELLARIEEGEHDLQMLAAGIGTPDCPMLKGIYEFNRLAAGATLLGIDLVLHNEVQRAFNLVGGFHHAGTDHAEGFCYVNDVGVGIASLLEQGVRVAFVDTDAHHCNGVQDRFLEDDRVLTISLHQLSDGFYPETGRVSEYGLRKGRGYSVNLPLAPGTDDEIYVSAFERVVPPLLEAFAPEIVIAEIGADTLISDPLTNLRLTSNGYEAVIKQLCDAAPRLVAVGGGGYDVFRTSNCWTLAFAAMCGIEPEDEFAGLVGGRMYGTEIGGLRDMQIATRGEVKERAREAAEAAVRQIHEVVFPVLGARVP